MRLLRATLVATILLAVLPPPVRADEPKDEIRAVLARYVAAAGQKDMDGLEGLLSEDAVIMPAEGPRFEGRRNAVSFWTGARTPRMSRTVQSVEVSGDLAWAAGVYSHRRMSGGFTVPPSNNFLVTLRRESDGWRVVRDIWNGGDSGVVPAR